MRIQPKVFLYILVVVLPVVAVGSYLWSVCIRWDFVYAAKVGNIKKVHTMLDNGMEPDTISHIGGIRAISMAAFGGHVDIVLLLLARGANPTYGLNQATMIHRVDIVRLLLAHGAKVSANYRPILPDEKTTPEDKAIERMLNEAYEKQKSR